MNSLNKYSDSIRRDIALEFGLEAGGYSPRPTNLIPTRIAQRIANKYPSDFSQGRFNSTVNPKAIVIAQRYVAIMSALKKGI
jgi:hypothetical protein